MFIRDLLISAGITAMFLTIIVLLSERKLLKTIMIIFFPVILPLHILLRTSTGCEILLIISLVTMILSGFINDPAFNRTWDLAFYSTICMSGFLSRSYLLEYKQMEVAKSNSIPSQ
jgi:hypothetical protein